MSREARRDRPRSRTAGRWATASSSTRRASTKSTSRSSIGPSPIPMSSLARWLTFRQSISEAIKLTPDAYFEIRTPATGARDVPGGRSRNRSAQGLAAESRLLPAAGRLRRVPEAVPPAAVPGARGGELGDGGSPTSARPLPNPPTRFSGSQLSKTFTATASGRPIWLRPTGDQRHSLI